MTIDGGSIQTGTNGGTTNVGEMALGSLSNNVILNGGAWYIQSDTSGTISHNIQVAAAGGIFGGGTQGGQTKNYSGSISDATNLPSGVSAGPLTLAMRNGSQFTFTNTGSSTNQWSGGTLIQGGGTVLVNDGVDFGSGPVDVASGTLTLNGTGTNSTSGTGDGQQFGPGREPDCRVRRNDQLPGRLANPRLLGRRRLRRLRYGHDGTTVLSVGGNDTSTTFFGIISQVATNATGSVTKVGTGNDDLGRGTRMAGRSRSTGHVASRNTGRLSGNGGGAVNNGALQVFGAIPGAGP